ncbi:50S ribosome-binding GTPase [Candidatus Saccharibacteria bacterium]|nr:50S ribosome-binding GTPase [Candidatus Saccharibacteria bacterium]
MSKLPIVALIGQTNAGKSSILNRMARKNIAIVAREEGTTRDNVMATIDNSFVLIDTAGLKDPSDDFEASIQDQIEDAISVADIILVTLDSLKYPDFRDKEIAKKALKSRKPVFLLLNKAELKDALPSEEFLSLGIKPNETFRVSATTGQGINELKAKLLAEPVFSNLNSSETRAKTKNSSLKLALIGRPNVGKSSLFNSLAKKQQAIVSSKQGTTRDVNRVNLKYKGRELEILDTAGLRKPGKREVGIEKFSAIRSLSAIEEADICALLVDATEPHSKLDQSLAGQIVEAGKGIVVVVTKTDLLKPEKLDESDDNDELEDPEARKPRFRKPQTTDEVIDNLERDFNFLPYAPVLLTSSETGENVTQLFELALEIDESRRMEIKTSELNKILNDAIISHPPAGLKNTRPKPKYIVQTDVCPPWFVVHGRDLGLLHWSWKRFLERKIREKYPFVGVPIKFSFRNDKKD